jgi:hypothetical protein
VRVVDDDDDDRADVREVCADVAASLAFTSRRGRHVTLIDAYHSGSPTRDVREICSPRL